MRARYGFATPDAIHLGADIASGCDAFPTNDIRITRFQDMDVDLIGANLWRHMETISRFAIDYAIHVRLVSLLAGFCGDLLEADYALGLHHREG